LIHKRKWDKGLGLWSNFLHELNDYSFNVTPKAQELLGELEADKTKILSAKEHLEFNAPQVFFDSTKETFGEKVEGK